PILRQSRYRSGVLIVRDSALPAGRGDASFPPCLDSPRQEIGGVGSSEPRLRSSRLRAAVISRCPCRCSPHRRRRRSRATRRSLLCQSLLRSRRSARSSTPYFHRPTVSTERSVPPSAVSFVISI